MHLVVLKLASRPHISMKTNSVFLVHKYIYIFLLYCVLGSHAVLYWI